MRTLLAFLVVLTLTPLATAQRIMGRTVSSTRTLNTPTPNLDTGDYQYVYSPAYGTATRRSGASGRYTMRGNRRYDYTYKAGLSTTSPLFAIEIGERGDKPCYVKVHYQQPGNRANLASWGGNSSNTFEMCGSRGVSTSSIIRAGAASAPTERQRPALRGLQVCSNDRRGTSYRVKGIRLKMATVNEANGGSVTTTGELSPAQQQHCRRWEPMRSCPSGEAVVSLDITYNRARSGNPVEITAITPRCAKLERVEADNTDECRAGGC